MSIRIMTAAGGAIVALAMVSTEASAVPRGGGTIAVRAVDEGDDADTLKRMSVDAVTAALGMKGFTILDDPDHAANVAEVVMTRTEVGSSVERGRAAPPVVTGMAVTIPTGGGKSAVVPLERTELEVRLTRRGEQQPFWHGAAVTIRSAGGRGMSAERIATTLSQAALGPYPSIVASPISIP